MEITAIVIYKGEGREGETEVNSWIKTATCKYIIHIYLHNIDSHKFPQKGNCDSHSKELTVPQPVLPNCYCLNKLMKERLPVQAQLEGHFRFTFVM